MTSTAHTEDDAPPAGRPALLYLSLGILPIFAAILLAMSAMQLPHASAGDLFILGLLAAAGIAAVRSEIAIGSLSVGSEWAALLSGVLLVPDLAPLLGLCVLATRYPTWRGYVASSGTEVIALGLSAQAIIALDLGSNDFIVGACVASGTMVLANVVISSFTVIGAGVCTLREYVNLATVTVLATFMLAAPIVLAIVTAVDHFGALAVPLILVPLLAANYFHGLYRRTLEMRDEIADKAQILARTNLQFAAAMVRALDTRDAYTAGHSAAVAVYTRDIAREMGFDDETVRLAHLAGLLHDIGKIGVPGRVLNKQSPLDDEEYELMKTHAAMGAEILGEVDLYHDIAILVRYHHERIDGRGYPDRLEGEAIPAISRMISVADTYSAMTTDRPYRDGMPTEKAMSILRECRGTQLDADFTDAFLRILIVADDAYQRGKQTDFEVEVAKHQALSEVEAEAVRVNAPTPAGPKAPAAPEVPMLPAAVDGELVEVDLEREAA